VKIKFEQICGEELTVEEWDYKPNIEEVIELERFYRIKRIAHVKKMKSMILLLE